MPKINRCAHDYDFLFFGLTTNRIEIQVIQQGAEEFIGNLEDEKLFNSFRLNICSVSVRNRQVHIPAMTT